MLIALKILSSSLAILLITEVAKKYSILGGLISMMPINIILSLIWLYIEKKDLVLLESFTRSALLGVIPTAFFLAAVLFFVCKNEKFSSTILLGAGLWVVSVFFFNKFLSNI